MNLGMRETRPRKFHPGSAWDEPARSHKVVKSPGGAWVNEALSVSGWGGGRWIGGALKRGEEQGQGRGSIPTCVRPLLLG